MNIAVVDDQKEEAALLIRFLHEYEKDSGIEISLFCFLDGNELIASLTEREYSIVFLDIFMEHMNGLEAAQQLWERDAHCLTIFLTVSREHLYQAAGLHCFDYIDKKDLTRERIFQVLTDAGKRLPSLHRTLDFTSGNRKVQLPVHHIQYILSDNNYTIFRMTDQTEHRLRVPFGIVCTQADNVSCFLNYNRGVLLNMEYITREDTDMYTMSDGQRFPIRRSDRAAIRNTYHNYQFEKLDHI